MQDTEQKQLRQFIEQIERLEEDKSEIAADIKDKYDEAKAMGYDAKIIRKVITLRKKSTIERNEEESLIASYMHALGMTDE